MSQTAVNSGKTAEKFQGPYLICPECKEKLVQADIEFFSRCPFCNHQFEQNPELEDYILEPVVYHWMMQQKLIPSLHPEDDEE